LVAVGCGPSCKTDELLEWQEKLNSSWLAMDLDEEGACAENMLMRLFVTTMICLVLPQRANKADGVV